MYGSSFVKSATKQQFACTHVSWYTNGSGGSKISHREGVDLIGGRGVDSRGSCVLKILYVKTKESRPLGGCTPGTFLDVCVCVCVCVCALWGW